MRRRGGLRKEISLPNPARRLDHQLELALLVVLADAVADDVGSEAALRAERKLLERQILRRLLDPAPQAVDGLELRQLGADESQDAELAFRNVAQGREAAGARAVVLEQEAPVRQLAEQALGDGVVVAFAVPHAVLVAAAEMDAEGDRIETLHQLGIGAQRAREIAHWVFAALSHRLERRRIDVSGVAGGIDLHVATAGVGDFADHAPLDSDHVLEESVDIRVDRFGLLVREALADAIGADQRHLERLLRMPAREAILIEQEVALEAQALEHRPAARHRGSVVVQVGQIEALERLAAGNALLGGAHIASARRKAAHRGAEAVLEVEATDLAVGHDIEPEILLEADRIAHRLILDAPERLCAQPAFIELRARLAPGGRAQQAAHHIGANYVERIHGHRSGRNNFILLVA